MSIWGVMNNHVFPRGASVLSARTHGVVTREHVKRRLPFQVEGRLGRLETEYPTHRHKVKCTRPGVVYIAQYSSYEHTRVETRNTNLLYATGCCLFSPDEYTALRTTIYGDLNDLLSESSKSLTSLLEERFGHHPFTVEDVLYLLFDSGIMEDLTRYYNHMYTKHKPASVRDIFHDVIIQLLAVEPRVVPDSNSVYILRSSEEAVHEQRAQTKSNEAAAQFVEYVRNYYATHGPLNFDDAYMAELKNLMQRHAISNRNKRKRWIDQRAMDILAIEADFDVDAEVEPQEKVSSSLLSSATYWEDLEQTVRAKDPEFFSTIMSSLLRQHWRSSPLFSVHFPDYQIRSLVGTPLGWDRNHAQMVAFFSKINIPHCPRSAGTHLFPHVKVGFGGYDKTAGVLSASVKAPEYHAHTHRFNRNRMSFVHGHSSIYTSFQPTAKFDANGRVDYSDIESYAIDSSDTTEVDDAVAIHPDFPNVVLIHISDPTEYIQPFTDVDLEAYTRSTSSYLPDNRVTMLPDSVA